MKNQTCCFTGHRKIPPSGFETIARRLLEEVISLVENGFVYFGVGGAVDFDTLAAQTVLLLKKDYPHIKLILVLSCKEQDKFWSAQDIKIYNQIRNKADKVVYTSEKYYNGCIQKRNRHLVDNSSVCLCYLTKQSGGTAYTVNYAREKGIRVINLA